MASRGPQDHNLVGWHRFPAWTPRYRNGPVGTQGYPGRQVGTGHTWGSSPPTTARAGPLRPFRPGGEESARLWEADGPQRQPMPGFHSALFAGNREANTTLAVTVWEHRSDAMALELLSQEFRARVADIVSGPPTIEEYDILVEVSRRAPAPALVPARW